MNKLFVVGLVTAAIILSPAAVRAAVPVSGLTISPALEQLTVAKGQTIVSFNAQVTNNTKDTVLISVSTQDFSTLGANNSINLLDSGTMYSHGLANAIHIDTTQLALPPNGSQTIPIIIQNTNTLSPGGHYAAILYKVGVLGAPSLHGNQIVANEEITSLIFLTSSGQGVRDIRLDTVAWQSFMTTLPTAVNLGFTNTGNVQTAPRGLVIIANASNQEVARGTINVDSGIILPNTERPYSVNLRLEKKVHPGVYHLIVMYQVDGNNTVHTFTKSFAFISWLLLLIGAIVGVSLLGLLIRRLRPHVRYRTPEP